MVIIISGMELYGEEGEGYIIASWLYKTIQKTSSSLQQPSNRQPPRNPRAYEEGIAFQVETSPVGEDDNSLFDNCNPMVSRRTMDQSG